jgi:DNA-binding winged helix-turn-helix (wHTH) protein/Flp pilus assembly protein TadD
MLKIGEWLLEPSSRRIVRGQDQHRLSPKALGVLLALAETPGRVWSRDALLERVWWGVTVGEEVLTHAVAELRRAFGDQARAPAYIETVHKGGYRLLCRPQRVPVADPLGAEGLAAEGDWATAPPEPATGDGFDLDAYGLYLGAVELYDRGGRQNTLRASQLLGEILAGNPDFALAHVAQAKALTFLASYYAPGEGRLDLALGHCEAAQRLGAGVAEAFAVQGLIFALAGDFGRSRSSFLTAIRLRPEAAETHYLLGRACLAELELELAPRMFDRAAALRPDDYHSLLMSAKVREGAGDPDGAKAAYALALKRIQARDEPETGDFRALCGLARCFWQLGRLDEAEAAMRRLAAHPDPMNYHLACALARTGDGARALDVLEEVVELGWRHRAWLERDPDFHALRDTPRFRRIAATVGLPN